jgi:hypothetical protein
LIQDADGVETMHHEYAPIPGMGYAENMGREDLAMRVRTGVVLGAALAALVFAGAATAQGLGGVLRKAARPEVITATCLGETTPGRAIESLPAGTLVAFLSGPDPVAVTVRRGFVIVSYLERGGLRTRCAWIREDAVQFFQWSCGAQRAGMASVPACSPVTTSGTSGARWDPRFLAQARTAARKLGLTLVEEITVKWNVHDGGGGPMVIP